MWVKIFPNECEFCGSKKIKSKSPIGTLYVCPRCGMVHGQLNNKGVQKHARKSKGR